MNGERLFVYRNPNNGDYDEPLEFGEDERVAPLAAPDRLISVADLLP